ncbi:MAG: argininosuccinate lyase [Christensenellales bacterium]|jgi:argininosuccinate lyase
MKLWGGRFEKGTNKAVEDFHSSIRFDKRLYKEDITGSIVHASMLGRIGILTPRESETIVAGLQSILADIENGKVTFLEEAEDIHMNVEILLTQRIGPLGGKLHTGRSRNDQVVLDMRMYVMRAQTEISEQLKTLQNVLISLSEKNTRTVMPGYTHLQKAQPITLAFHLMAYFEMFQRDRQRLADAQKRTDSMPLGSGALAGTTYPLDRIYVAEQLGFTSITRNALDGVSDRDFVIETLAALSMIMTHLSRFCEEIILWNTQEFGYIVLDDSFSTGSSIMPQKKNPDVAELIRGKTGRVYGDLTTLLSVMKGLPLAYNKDMQEDKEALFDAVDTVSACLHVFTEMLLTSNFEVTAMEQSANGGFTNATDAADYLVNKGIPFRQAHEIVGKMVLHCVKVGCGLKDLTIAELQAFSPLINQDFFEAIDLHTCIEERKLPGGPATQTVEQHIAFAKKLLEM